MFLSACKQENSQGQANLHKSRQTPPTAVFHLLRSLKVPIFLILLVKFSYQAIFLSLFVPTFKIMGWFDEK